MIQGDTSACHVHETRGLGQGGDAVVGVHAINTECDGALIVREGPCGKDQPSAASHRRRAESLSLGSHNGVFVVVAQAGFPRCRSLGASGPQVRTEVERKDSEAWAVEY